MPTQWSEGGVSLRRGGNIEVRARGFDLAAIHPFVDSLFGDLHGRLDGQARLLLGTPLRFSGQLSIEDGCWQVANYGETFTDTSARLDFESPGTVRLRHFRATSLSGELSATGIARFDGLALRSGRLELRVSKNRPLPVVVGGNLYGEAFGRVEIHARRHASGLYVEITAPKLEVEVARRLPRGAQKLEPVEHVVVGVRRRGSFAPIALRPRVEGAVKPRQPVTLQLSLGDVVVRQGRTLWAEVGGSLRFTVADEVRARGALRIKRGTLEVQGKELELEQGVVTFTGRPIANPMVNITAKWVAPDGTEIFADFVGPLDGGKLTLRSNPPLNRDEIVAMLLFGSPEGYSEATDATGRADRATQAVGLGGGIVAGGLNEAIDGLTNLDIGVRLDTSRASGPAPEVEVRLARTLSLQVSYLLGLPGPGESPDRTFATLSWRFLAEWVIEATVGDQGATSADVLWQHRY